MKTNMGTTDRAIRIIVAVILGVAAYTGNITGGWAIAASVVAGIFVVTSFVSFCPLYALIGVNTCPTKVS